MNRAAGFRLPASSLFICGLDRHRAEIVIPRVAAKELRTSRTWYAARGI